MRLLLATSADDPGLMPLARAVVTTAFVNFAATVGFLYLSQASDWKFEFTARPELGSFCRLMLALRCCPWSWEHS